MKHIRCICNIVVNLCMLKYIKDIADSLQRLRNAEIHGTSILLNPNEIEEICDYIRRTEDEIDELAEEIKEL